MTRERQRNFEKEAVDSLLHKLNIDAGVSFQAPPEPDFLLKIGAISVGLEITEYYSSSERKEFEQAWLKIQKKLNTLSPTDVDLPALSVVFEFKRLRVPNTKCIPKFIEEIISYLKFVTNSLTPKWQYFNENDFVAIRYPLLNEFVRKLGARRIQNSFHWRCLDIAVGWVGVSEQELIKIVNKKKQKIKKYTHAYEEVWLAVVAGEGENISSQMGHMFHYKLPSYESLNRELRTCLFDKFYVYNDNYGYPLIVWEKNNGWIVKIDKDGQPVQNFSH